MPELHDMRHIFVIDDPGGRVYGRRRSERDVATQLLGEIEESNGNDCGVSISVGVRETFIKLVKSIEAGDPDPDLIQRAKWILEERK